MPYRAALPASQLSTDPTFPSLLRAAWRTTRSRWLLAAVSLAGALVGWGLNHRVVAYFAILFALVVFRTAIDAAFDQWVSWVPNLSDVRRRSTSVVVLLCVGVLAVSLALARVFGRLYVAKGPSPADAIVYTDRVSAHLVVAVVAFVCSALPPVLRWRPPRV